ncbi:hypothetical protein RclHR1_10140008 [Rhizophagus clarus]|uniref:BTB domain-containing protein n=1 Tax=Rhizophagus clarus TaxID=94130 RepID=A0A2Z6Q0U6_9GLOM|nr:hypothetical protein RclHR1_10140008 [Rhizophagus clarus]
MVLRYIYGGSLSLEEYDTLDIIKILVASNELSLQELIIHLQLFLIENKKNWMEQNFNLVYKTSFENNSFLKLQNFCIEFIYSKDDFITLRNTLQQCIPFINFFNLTSKEYLGKVYPYKKIIPKDMRENLFRHFMDQSNSNPEPIITKEVDSITISIIEYFNDHNIDAQETYNCLNYEKAFNLFISASEKDHTLAQFFLGDCYKIGRGTIKNEKLTFEYYEKAANKNLSQGQTSIGYCYKNGACVKKDLIKAFYWYEKAAKNGNITAISNLGHCYDNGIGITVDKQKAFELYQNAANLGKKVAQYNLALMYEKGDGIIKDIDKAIYWYEKSAKQGDKDAQNKLKILQKNQ